MCHVQVCTEAGLLALRERRMKVTHKDFQQATEKVLYKKKGTYPEGVLQDMWSQTSLINLSLAGMYM